MHKRYVPEKAKRVIGSFLQRDPEALMQSQAGAPEADAYEFQSEGVIQMFDDLEHKMADERADGQKTEMNEKYTYDMLMQDFQNRMERTTGERERDIAEKAETEATLAEDEKYLAELRQMCKTKTAEFESRQELRQGEQDAIAKAVEILGGGAVSGAADKHLPGLVQRSTSLAQLKGSAVSPFQGR